jgi:chaperonin GroEL (HSP60 family)
MSRQEPEGGADVDRRLAALLTNANAVRFITAAVEGTIGPKGLDTMLVGGPDEVIITNDGVTILEKMDVSHPAAKIMINVARAQQDEVGDGTTTATLMAGTLVAEGVNQVLRGVPVARVIEGIKFGIKCASDDVQARARRVADIHDRVLTNIALIAGREHHDIADLVVSAAGLIGTDKLTDPTFKLSEIITAQAGAANEVFPGVVVSKGRLNEEMPATLTNVRVLVVDDALEPEEVADEALHTDAGFKRYLQLNEDFKKNIHKIVAVGVKLVLVDRGVHETAAEILTDAGCIVLQRVPHQDLQRAAEHTGARQLKRTALNKDNSEIAKYLGFAANVYEDELLEQLRISGGHGKPMATVIVGAATPAVAGERERIAKDAAASVQAAVKGGYVSGGGSVEIAIARTVQQSREQVKGVAAYGVDCVIHALKRPLSQIVDNAGFNHLEKVEEVLTAQNQQESDSLGIDCDTGELTDMLNCGIIDPAPVKLQAIKAAGEVAVAILRIDKIIKKQDERPEF